MVGRLGVRAAAVIVAVGVVLALAAAQARASSVTEFTIPTAASGATAVTAGPDGGLWFTEESANQIGRMATGGSFTEFVVPTVASSPDTIVAGPDGALWFTEFVANQIGRATTGGSFTEFPVPTAGSRPGAIAVGPDGALWFTESAADQIGRVTTGGSFTEYAIPTPSGSPNDITAGSDGALWFTESGGNKIGRVTTGGSFTEFPVPTASSRPTGIASGPDGALWFTELGGNKIGRITTGGSFSEFPVPTASSRPLRIVAGPDGALWFTERNGNRIGRVTTGGTFTEYPVSTPASLPEGIGVGPDGALWFTEFDGNNIGRIAPPVASATGLGSSLNPSVPGQSVTLTATVTGDNPTGAVDFEDGSTTIAGCGARALGGGTATCTTSSLALGSHSIVAVYGGDSNNLASSSGAFTQTVAKAVTATGLISSQNPSTVGQSVTFTATVTGFSPTGTVAFKDGSATIAGCGAVALGSATATCSVSSLGTGSHPITAVYGGDPANAASTSSVLTEAVGVAGSAVTLGSSRNPSTAGQAVTFTATVSGSAPTGTVAFDDGSSAIAGCATVALSSGKATCTTSSLAGGSHSITAVYGGDANNAGSSSAALNQIVVFNPSTVTLTSSPDPAQPGYPVTFTATVTGSSPVGTVTFEDGGSPIAGCLSVTLRAGRASCTTSLSAGAHSITARYNGDSNNAPAFSAVLVQLVAAQVDSMFLCYSKFEQDGGAVFEAQQAATLLAAGYWLPSAVAGNVDGGDNLGGYHLQCNPPADLTPTGQWIDGGGNVIDANQAADARTGVYPVVA